MVRPHLSSPLLSSPLLSPRTGPDPPASSSFVSGAVVAPVVQVGLRACPRCPRCPWRLLRLSPCRRMSEQGKGSASASAAAPAPGSDTYKGWLFKWTNYLKGYQRRWFVLSNGLLSYYRTQAEMAHTCRGTINLATAHIDTEDACNIVLSSGGRTYHLKASTEVERQRWVTALELAKAKAIRMMNDQSDDSGDEEPASQTDRSEIQGTLKILVSKLDDLSTCNDLIAKHGAALQRSLSELEGLRVPVEGGEKIKAVNERATLFRITSNAMINACRDFLDLAETHSRRWQRALQYEREQRTHLEETIEQLAKQHNSLERAWREAPTLVSSTPSAPASNKGSERPLKEEPSDEDEDTEYFDAMEDSPAFITVTATENTQHRRSQSNLSGASGGQPNDWNQDDHVSVSCNDVSGKELQPRRQRRTHIPDKPNYSLNLWSIMKNCIGKELSKIPMPVNFNEPLSMLQRLSEDLEYHELLDKAARCDSSLEQMCLVAAFSVSSYSTTVHRTAKPFNPLLGETYELDRWEEFGYRSLCEQVSHHPPAAAHHVISQRGWTLWQEITIASKFRGKYLSIMPLGAIHLQFHSSGNHYVWRKVTSTVHNIIVGKLWIDQSGDIEIVNHRTKETCQLKFSPYSYFSRELPRKVTGVVADSGGQAHYILSGTWDDKIESAKIIQSSRGGSGSEGKQKTVYQTLSPKLLWKKYPLPENAENMYYFSALALTLNEPDDRVGMTDSRLRPDQRLMEEGRWDEANAEKQRLEEKQRAVRRRREAEATDAQDEGKEYEGYQPLWFHQRRNSITGETNFVYQGGYWEAKDRQDWSVCQDIF
ncbi:oxysterol-binding protein 2 isoform X2 [Genypterus blacodes]|uniref:oxysterol-binding protein 2 isoform X2 n=1 Tax=Genypterus blacodes TaxID=154954 RepID=UPI003F774A7A